MDAGLEAVARCEFLIPASDSEQQEFGLTSALGAWRELTEDAPRPAAAAVAVSEIHRRASRSASPPASVALEIEALFLRAHHRFSAVGGAELPQHAGHVCLDGVLRQCERPCDLLVRQAAAEQTQHVLLARG